MAIQALVAAGAGSILGVLAAFGGAQLIMALRPQFLVTLEPTTVAQSLVAGLEWRWSLHSFPPAWSPVLAPAEVFRR